MAVVYVIGPRGKGLCKIGVTTRSVKTRLSQLQVATTEDLVLHAEVEADDAYGVEEAAHCLLREYRVRGEWFAVSPDVAIGAVRESVENQDSEGSDGRVGIGEAIRITGRSKTTILSACRRGHIDAVRDNLGRLRLCRKGLDEMRRELDAVAGDRPRKVTVDLSQPMFSALSDLAEKKSAREGRAVTVGRLIREIIAGQIPVVLEKLDDRWTDGRYPATHLQNSPMAKLARAQGRVAGGAA